MATVLGTSGSDVFDTSGGFPNISFASGDTLIGGLGNDTYALRGLFGTITVRDYSFTTNGGGSDTIDLKDASAANVVMSRNGTTSDLVISRIDAAGQRVSSVTIENQFGGDPAYLIETLKFSNGTSLNLTGPLTVKGVLGQGQLFATSLNDTLSASAWDETLYGGIGNDTYLFSGTFGNDTIQDRTFALGGSGTDTISLAGLTAANVRMSRSSQNENLVISVVNSLGTAQSTIVISGQFGSNVNDVIENLKIGSAAAISLTGGLTMQGVRDQSSLFGTSLGDKFIANSWNETFYGGIGSDIYQFSGSFGIDAIQDRTFSLGGGGSDSIHFLTATAASVRMSRTSQGSDLAISVVNSAGTALSTVNIQDQFSSNVNNVIEFLKIGTGSAISLTGGLTMQGVRDQRDLFGTGFNDRFIGNAWNEQFYGGVGNDTYVFSGRFGMDTVQDRTFTLGGGGTDTIDLGSVGRSAVRLSRAGSDLVVSVVDSTNTRIAEVTLNGQYSGTAADVIESLRTSTGTQSLTGGLTIQGVRDQLNVYGTTFKDTVIANAWNENLAGGGASDIYRFSKGFGFDRITEGTSNGGTDRIVFDSSINVADVRIQRVSSFSNDLVIGVARANETFVSSLTVSRYFTGGDYKVEYIQFGSGTVWSIDSLLKPVTGTSSADVITSRPGNTVISGLGGKDTITDLWGNNTLSGGSSNDRLIAGSGEDILIGGSGKDVMTGGSGLDRFMFNAATESTVTARDVITDFKRGDKVDLRKIDADTDGTSGNQAFKFIGSGAFTKVDGQLRFSGGVLSGDLNGDGKADFQIELTGVKSMLATDFFL